MFEAKEKLEHVKAENFYLGSWIYNSQSLTALEFEAYEPDPGGKWP